MKPWEFHPAVVHFPLAFLLSSPVLDVAGLRNRSESPTRSAAGLYLAGVVSAIPAIAFGIVAWLTVPHSKAVHVLMYWHPAFAIFSVFLFTLLTLMRWRNRANAAQRFQLVPSVVASITLIVAGYLGGHLVYRGGAGIKADHDSRNDGNHTSPGQEDRPPSAEDALKEKQR